MRSLLDAVKLADLIQSVDTGGETTVKAEDLVLDDSGQREVIEELSELFPDISVTILSQTLIIESVSKTATIVVNTNDQKYSEMTAKRKK